jgi:hypothetical protein
VTVPPTEAPVEAPAVKAAVIGPRMIAVPAEAVPVSALDPVRNPVMEGPAEAVEASTPLRVTDTETDAPAEDTAASTAVRVAVPASETLAEVVPDRTPVPVFDPAREELAETVVVRSAVSKAGGTIETSAEAAALSAPLWFPAPPTLAEAAPLAASALVFVTMDDALISQATSACVPVVVHEPVTAVASGVVTSYWAMYVTVGDAMMLVVPACVQPLPGVYVPALAEIPSAA